VIGNEAIGQPEDRFLYLSEVNMNSAARAASFGNGLGAMYTVNGVLINRYSNPEITWERAFKSNIALEIGLFNKINIVAEYYKELRKDIFMNRASIPVTMGLSSAVSANIGEASGQGTDISIEYNQSVGANLWFQGRGNFTYSKNKYRIYEEPQYSEYYRSRVGNPIYQTYGYIAERLFIDDGEAANSPTQNFGGAYPVKGGDIKYTDVNREGIITEADMVPIGNPTLPEIVYGFGFSAGFKNWDFSAFLQGLANESFWIDPSATSPFANYRTQAEIDRSYLAGRTLNNQLLKAYADSYWSEDVRDIYALWPRLSPQVNTNNSQRSTWFMRDGSFLRLKTVELGYTLPKKLQKSISTSAFRIYVSANNLLNFSKFDLWDVEMGGNGLGYPLQRVYNIGLKVDFN
jgi:TonB-linked SusC/RagA family outer membrane protein